MQGASRPPTHFISSGSSLSSFVGATFAPLFLARGQPDKLVLKVGKNATMVPEQQLFTPIGPRLPSGSVTSSAVGPDPKEPSNSEPSMGQEGQRQGVLPGVLALAAGATRPGFGNISGSAKR